MAHTSATVSSAAVIPGNAGASRPTAVPGNCSGRTAATTPAAHSAARRSTPNDPSAPAVASASAWGTVSRTRRARSARPR